jgi:antagonist of KipI
MDWYSHRLANRLVGNEEQAALLEITLLGPEIEVNAETVCVVTGAEFEVRVNGTATAAIRPFVIPSGGRVRFAARRSGARAMLAVRGGLDVPAIFGSRATSLSAGMGPLGGRPLMAGDMLPVGTPHMPAEPSGIALPLPQGGARVRILRGPHDAMFTSAACDTLCRSRFTVTPESNRMGYRLQGPALEHGGAAEILSEATPIGSLQVPGSGQPILLMADRQTTGGYPKIATVITADLPIAGQLAPGDWIEFQECTRAEAVAALHELVARLSK